MNAPTLARSPDDSDLINKFVHADTSVRARVIGIWIEILVESYRVLVKELQAISNYSLDAIAARIISCQQRFQAHPEYHYVLQYGQSAQIEYVKNLLASLATPPAPPRYVEPVTLIRPSLSELRQRIKIALA